MKRGCFACVVSIFILLATVPVSAQSILNGVVYDVGAGLSLPFGEFTDCSTIGFTVGSDVFVWTPGRTSPIQLGTRLAFNWLPVDTGCLYDGGHTSVIDIVPTMRYHFQSSGTLRIFGQICAGLFLSNYSVDYKGGGKDSGSDTDIGLTIGGGFTYRIQRGKRIIFMPLLNFVSDRSTLGVNVGMVFSR